MTAPLYSQAKHCGTCAQRRLLTRAQAERAVTASHGRLLYWPCPHGDGWHVDLPANRAERKPS